MKDLFLTLVFLLPLLSAAQQSRDSVVVELSDRPEVPLRVGLVFSGGGAKGLAHIGVLKVLEEEGVYVDYVGGTSMGGLIGGLYACGYSPEQIEIIAQEMPWDKLLADEPERNDLPLDEKTDLDQYILGLPLVGFVPGLPKGLKRGQLILNYINKLTWNVAEINEFEKLPIPFFCVATKLETGDTMVITQGNLPMAMRATMSIPSVFEPIKFNGEYVIDGGLVNNYPVDVMLEKAGVDYVIGVDVGAPLYKADEINNIIEILDQTSSYHQQRRHKTNKRLTDLYIKPDITGLSALSFEDVDSIIKRGEDAARAQLVEIRKLARLMNDNKSKIEEKRSVYNPDTIFISQIEIAGLEKASRKMVVGRLGLNIPGTNSIEKINLAMDRLYSSNLFRKIDYKLIPVEMGYVLDLVLEEKTENTFELGANYNSELGAGLKMNLSFHNFLARGSKMNLSFVVGQNPAGEIRYLIDRGRKLGLGSSIGYNSRSIFTYDEEYAGTTGQYFTSFSSLSLYGYLNYSNNSALLFGGQLDFFAFKPEVSAILVDELNEAYYRCFVRFVNDSYDNKYFPTRGKLLSLEADYIKPDVGDPIPFFRVDMGSTIPVSSDFMILSSAFVGGSMNEIDKTGYAFVVGGANQSDYEGFVSMPGLPYTSVITNNFAAGYLDFRYEIFPKNFIMLRTSIGASAEDFRDLLTDSQLLFAATLGYSIQSAIGPIGIQFGKSNLGNDLGGYFNLGMYF